MALIIAGIALIVFFVVIDTKEQMRNPRKYTEMRCPTCGSPARNYGSSWECTYCGDFGNINRH